jgi:UDP-glucose 4-epimerase
MKNNIKNKKILITGGAGFIGSHLADELIKQGAKVIILDNLSTGLRKNINPETKFYKIDINNSKIDDIIKIEKPEIIYLLACNTIVPKSVEDPLFDIKSLVGNLNIMVSAKKNNVKKIIAISSGFVYGNTKKLPTPEDSEIIPNNPYIINKSSTEKYLEFFGKTYDIDYVILRYATVYGPRQVGGAMADYIRCIKDNKSADIYGDGNKTRDYVFIDDVTKANILALNYKNNNTNTPIFNIGTGVETTLNALYFKIADILVKKSKPYYLKDRNGEMVRFKLSTIKAKKYLGWQAETRIEEGLKKILNK